MKTASIGLCLYKGEFYLQIISAEEYEFYYVQISPECMQNIATREGIECDEIDYIDVNKILTK